MRKLRLEQGEAVSLADKRVLVTGATRGIGRATAAQFLEAGAKIAVNGSTIDAVARCIREFDDHKKLVAAPGDISTVDGCEAVVQAAVEMLGGLDILVNNAGVFQHATIADSDERVWDFIMDTNVKGTFFCSRAALPALLASKDNIVNVASISGLQGYSQHTVYCTSKGAVVNLTRSMAIELAPNVRVNCVCPGLIDTDMARSEFGDMEEEREWYPLRRIGTADEVAKAITYLASADAGFVTGSALVIDGGATAGG
jgi:NAD(P)-dependent dehydrogenase (short-subunit alcohol dehydrogenase family)